MSTDKAIDTIHTMTMRDGTVAHTTWHDTEAEARTRADAPAGATFRGVFPCGVLGAFRAVTWMPPTNAPRWKYQHDTAAELHTSEPTDARGLRLRSECGYTHVHMGTADGWLQIAVAIRKVELAERLTTIAAGAEAV